MTGTTETTARTGCRPNRPAAGGARAGRRAGLGRVVALAAATLASSALLAAPALAHHFTGEVQLWASTVDFQDTPGGVLVKVRLIERESGESVSGFGARVAATGGGEQVGPVELQESEFAVYSGTLPLAPGRWEILVTTHQGRSSLPAIESSHRRTLEIDATGRLVVSEGGGSGATTTLAIVLPISAVAVMLLIMLRRRRLAPEEDPATNGDPDPAGGGDAAAVPASEGEPSRDRG